MKEIEYQTELIPRIYAALPGRPLVDTIVYVNDPNQIQGIPDLTVFHRGKYAYLETKLSEKSKRQPNQTWYIEHWGQWIFTAFIWPANEEEVLRALEQELAGRR